MEEEPLREAFPVRLSISQVVSLRLLARCGARPMGELARLLGVTPPATTKMVDKLERLGLAERAAVPGDRRGTLVDVSLKGRGVVQRYERAREDRLNRVMSHFTEAELARFSESLEIFSVRLLAACGQPGGACLRCSAEIEEDCVVSRALGRCPAESRPGVRLALKRSALKASGA